MRISPEGVEQELTGQGKHTLGVAYDEHGPHGSALATLTAELGGDIDDPLDHFRQNLVGGRGKICPGGEDLVFASYGRHDDRIEGLGGGQTG